MGRRRESAQETWERMRSNSASGEQPPAPAPAPAATPAPPRETSEHEVTVERPPEREAAPAVEHGASHDSSESSSGDQPVAELVKQLTEQTKTLVKQEMRLAQVELQDKGKKLGIGAGMFGAGGLVAFFGAGVLIAALVLGLATALAPWLSALIVGVVLLAAAGGAALMGKKKVEEATPPAPKQAIGNIKRDVDTVKRRARK